jgi:hypothetical protein
MKLEELLLISLQFGYQAVFGLETVSWRQSSQRARGQRATYHMRPAALAQRTHGRRKIAIRYNPDCRIIQSPQVFIRPWSLIL